jgi:DNA invertase Pin-like site-specific DNA recombinase
VQDDLETTRGNYDEQLSAMTEHLMAVNAQLAEAQEENAVLRQKTGAAPAAKKGGRW